MRTLLLSLLAAQQGVASLGKWHDPLGVGILVGCFIGIWIVAHFFSRNVAPSARSLPVQNRQHAGTPHRSVGRWTILVTAAILVFGEVGVRAWYASRRVVTSDVQWTLELPKDNRDFEPVPIAPVVFRFLRFNEGHSARWRNADGTLWQLFYFRWDPGRTAVHLARGHTPEICLPAAGHKLLAMSHLNDVRLGSVGLPFRSFMSGTRTDPLFVFYTIWEEGLSTQNVASETLTWSTRWTFVKERRRNPGQRVIQVGIRGAGTMEEAEASLRRELPRVIRVEGPSDRLPGEGARRTDAARVGE